MKGGGGHGRATKVGYFQKIIMIMIIRKGKKLYSKEREQEWGGG